MKIHEESELDELAPWLVLIITLVGGGLRIMLLPKNGLWLDETFMWMANQSIGDMLHWVGRIDQRPPLYYLLLHFWVTINGAGLYYVRLLSAMLRGHNPGDLLDRQTHFRGGGGTRGSGAPGIFAFQHLLRPRNADVHAADV